MRTAEKTVYTVSELSLEAFERAHKDFQESMIEIDWQSETIDSLKAVIKATGADLTDWELGAYSRGSFIKVDAGECSELSGKRALAWFENNVVGPLRVPFAGKRRKDLAKYTRPGQIPSCPLTGYCTDEDFLDNLKSDLVSGSTVGEALTYLGNKCVSILESEYDSQMSEEYFKETSEANQYEYTESGRLWF